MSYKSFLDFVPVTYKECDRGWLSPDCKFYPCSAHEEWAWEYLRQMYDNDEDGSNWDIFYNEITFNRNGLMMEYLKELGWIELRWFQTVIDEYGKLSNNMSHHYESITDEQKKLVRKWYINHGVYKEI